MGIHLHSKSCLAAAVIAAVENLRDMEGQTDHEFRIEVQKNTPLSWADSYLSDGTMTCTCGSYEMDHVMQVLASEGPTRATALAAEYLRTNRLSINQYIGLVRESEGRHSAYVEQEG